MRKSELPFTGGDGAITSIMHEALARYTIDGKIGYGIVESNQRDVIRRLVRR